MNRVALVTLLVTFLLSLMACSGQAATGGTSTAPRVYFTSPADGTEVSGTVKVTMATENFKVEPAADGVHAGAGHLHIMVDSACIASGQAIPKDDTHLHYGNAQLEAELELAPGTHTLCLQAADGAHIALDGAGLQQTITVTVE